MVHKGLFTQTEKDSLVAELSSYFPPFQFFDDSYYTFMIFRDTSISGISLRLLYQIAEKQRFNFAVVLAQKNLPQYQDKLVIQLMKT